MTKGPPSRAENHQPHLNPDRMWTIDDIRRLEYEIKDPLKP
jgi:hypothetical protein